MLFDLYRITPASWNVSERDLFKESLITLSIDITKKKISRQKRCRKTDHVIICRQPGFRRPFLTGIEQPIRPFPSQWRKLSDWPIDLDIWNRQSLLLLHILEPPNSNRKTHLYGYHRLWTFIRKPGLKHIPIIVASSKLPHHFVWRVKHIRIDVSEFKVAVWFSTRIRVILEQSFLPFCISRVNSCIK